uniref:ATP synthase complex subunit 8 n=1 Tax=Eviota ocellifer TaxID=2301492 RepID=A0A5K7TNQ0_9GOBI|nr:ATPase subunit 8 [Eviota ocellifer]
MPQLNPAPWFNILVFSWLVLVTIIIPKTLNRTSPNHLSPQSSEPLKTEPWLWQ